MDKLIQRVLIHLRSMWHRRWIGLAVAWIAAIVAVSSAFRVPERYEATARVFVDTQSLLRPLMAGLSIQPNLDQQVALISRTLISRPNVEKLVRMADLDLPGKSRTGGDDLVDSVTRNIQLVGNATTNLYVILYRDTNPDQAKKVVESLVAIFVESSLGGKREDSQSAVRFVDEQIKRYEVSLKAAEDRLKEFRLKYLGITGTGTRDYFTRLSTLNDAIAATQLQLRAAEESRDAYKRELAGEEPVLMPQTGTSTAPSALSSPVDARLAVLRSDLDLLRRRFTDDHPDVVGTKRIIDQLEEQRRQDVDVQNKATAAAVAAGGQAPVSAADRNPVFQQLKFALANAEANVASLRATVASYENQAARLKSSARLVPEVDAELAQLNRDYDIQKRTYEALLSRRESAAMGEGVVDAGGTRLRVIDPPRVSPNPVAPTRMMLLGAALVVSLLAGLAASFGAAQLMPTFHDARSLAEIAKRPVLGMVTMFPTDTVRRVLRWDRILFAAGAGGLVASFAAIGAFSVLMTRAA